MLKASGAGSAVVPTELPLNLAEYLVTVDSGVVDELLTVFKFGVPTSFVWIAVKELRIFSIMVVGFSLVIVSIMFV